MARKKRAKAAKKIVIIAGPNGAGKTTFAQEFRARRDKLPVGAPAALMHVLSVA